MKSKSRGIQRTVTFHGKFRKRARKESVGVETDMSTRSGHNLIKSRCYATSFMIQNRHTTDSTVTKNNENRTNDSPVPGWPRFQVTT